MVNLPSKIQLILFFSRGVSLRTWDEAGMLTREVALYQRLQGYGIRVTFVTYGSISDLAFADRIPGIRILCNRWGLAPAHYERWLPLLHAPWLWRTNVIKTNQTDGATVALRAARFWRKPLIARSGYMWSYCTALEHGGGYPLVRHAQKIEATVFSVAQRVVVTTSMMAADIARRIPEAAGRTVVVPNYVETELFRPANERGRDYDIIFVGRMTSQKNVDALLKAVQPLDVKVALIGSGELHQDLQRRFASLNGRVKWLGNIPNVELPSYLNRAGIFILPSHYEGHPKALIEAMACGLPVIGADSPGIRELVHHGETGWLCGTDPESIRAAIQELLAHPELCAQLGQNARRFVLKNFALDRIVELELAVLREVVAK